MNPTHARHITHSRVCDSHEFRVAVRVEVSGLLLRRFAPSSRTLHLVVIIASIVVVFVVAYAFHHVFAAASHQVVEVSLGHAI